MPVPYTNLLLNYLVTILVFKSLIRDGFNPDVIHAHEFTAGIPAVILGHMYKKPVVITEHFTGFTLHTLNRLEILMARFAMKRAQKILPVSDDLKNHIQSYGIKSDFKVVPNVVNTNLFCVEPCKITNDPKRLLTVALLNPKKGIPYLLQAIHKLRGKRQDFILDIIGDGPNRKDYEALSIKDGINDIVKFHGIKNKKEISQLMKIANIFVLPSLTENLPCVLIEAMASGLPIIATNVGGVPELISEDIGQLVSPKNPDALAEAIDYMLDHYKDYNPRSIARNAQDKYSYGVVGSQLDTIYQQVINNYKKVNRSL